MNRARAATIAGAGSKDESRASGDDRRRRVEMARRPFTDRNISQRS
jgi:hypothetical protein